MAKKITLQGIIIVNDFDSKGNPVRFALLTDDESKYLLEPDKKNSDNVFAKYNRKKVMLTGMTGFEGKKKVLTVNEIKILKNSQDSSYLDSL